MHGANGWQWGDWFLPWLLFVLLLFDVSSMEGVSLRMKKYGLQEKKYLESVFFSLDSKSHVLENQSATWDGHCKLIITKKQGLASESSLF